MDTSQLDQLIVEHLSDLDSAASQVHRIERRVWTAMARLVEAKASSLGWAGEFDIDGHLWLCPPVWMVEGDAVGYFELDFGPSGQAGNEGEPHFDLSRLCGVGGGSMAFCFRHDGGKRAWKPVAKEGAASVAGLGFALDDHANFHVACTPAQAEMARALADDDFEQALQPLSNAMDRLPASVAAFTSMLQLAKAL